MNTADVTRIKGKQYIKNTLLLWSIWLFQPFVGRIFTQQSQSIMFVKTRIGDCLNMGT